MNFKIPLFDLNYGREEEYQILKTIRSKWISMGQNVKQLEDDFAKHLTIDHAVALTNGTVSLHLALKVLGIGEGDEVIVPSLTFVATVNVVRYVGATPIFADVTSFEDFSIDPEDIGNKITSNTKALIVMHYAGFACNMDEIMRIAKEHDLFVIEDAAHAPDSEYKDKKLGTIGDIGCFSFFSNKNISCAEGGILATDNSEYAKRAKLLRSHGMISLSERRDEGCRQQYDISELGYNYRMDDIRGALARAQLRKLEDDTNKRKALRNCYLESLSFIKDIFIPYKDFKYQSSNHIMPIVLKNCDAKKRDGVRHYLAESGIQTSVHYPAVHKFSLYDKYKSYLPKTEYIADCEITLPLFYNLTKDEIKYISLKIGSALNKIR